MVKTLTTLSTFREDLSNIVCYEAWAETNVLQLYGQQFIQICRR